MRSRHYALAAVLAAGLVVLPGCHGMLKPAPSFSKPLAVTYSGQSISMQDIPAGIYRLPDSQVIISGHQKATRSPFGLMFGLAGVLIADQIDKNGARSAVKSSADALRITLAPEARDTLATLVSGEALRDRYTATVTRGEPQLEIDSALVLTFINDSAVQPCVVLRATLKQYAKNKDIQEPKFLWATRYMACQGPPRALVGEGSWAADDGQALRAVAAAELKQAMRYLVSDVASPVPRDESRQVVVSGHLPFLPGRYEVSGIRLGEDGDSVAFLPHMGDGTVLAGVMLLDHSQVSVRKHDPKDRTFRQVPEPTGS